MNVQNAMNDTNQTLSKIPNWMSEHDISGLKLSSEWHIAFLTVIFGYGVIGNAFVIYIYAAKVKQRSFNIYVISMAACDIVACLISASQMPLVHWYKMQEMKGIHIYIKTFNLTIWLTTFWTTLHLLMIAIDRVNAVYKNNAYRQSKTRVLCKTITILICGILFIVPIILMQIFVSRPTTKTIVLAVSTVGGTCILFTFTLSYILILNKIVLSTKQLNSIETSTKNTSHTVNAHRDRRTNRIVKQFLLLTIVYLICFIPQTIGVSFNLLIFRYFFYANQLANPIVYFIVDKSFRKNIRRVFISRSNICKR